MSIPSKPGPAWQSFDEWQSARCHVKSGEKSRKRGADGIPLFHRSQTELEDYSPSAAAYPDAYWPEAEYRQSRAI